MLIGIPPKYNVSEIVGYLTKVLLLYLKGMQTENISVGIEHFGAGCDVDTVGKNTKKIRKYINNPLKEDFMADQILFSEYIDSFASKKVNK